MIKITREDALEYHRLGNKPGKIAIVPTKPMATQRDLGLAYTPGVAVPVLEIAKDPELAYEYTSKGNLVAVVSNGTAILGLGDRGDLGTNRFAHDGMVRKVIAAHFTWSPRMQQLVREEKVEAYCFPGGVIQQLLREIGAGRPGLFTHSGLGTFVDPRQDGGRCNARSRDTLVELMHVDGREILHYKPFTVDVAIVRGTYADARGNISPEEEAIDMDVHSMALAAHNTGGLVLAQVRQVVEAGGLHARSVRIPGIMVDAVVEARDQQQFYGLGYDATVSGGRRARQDAAPADVPAKLERRIIARRAALELRPGASLNFGFGIPGGIFWEPSLVLCVLVVFHGGPREQTGRSRSRVIMCPLPHAGQTLRSIPVMRSSIARQVSAVSSWRSSPSLTPSSSLQRASLAFRWRLHRIP